MSMSESEQKWGQRPNNPNAHWVKMRELVGKQFRLVRVNKGEVKERPSFIFECEDGALFSAGVGQTLGKQIERDGIPPTPANYTIEQKPSPKSPTGYALVLRAL